MPRVPMWFMMFLLALPRLAAGAEVIHVRFLDVGADADRYRLISEGDNAGAVEICGSDEPTTSRIAEVARPAVDSHQYVARGRVKCEGVSGRAYLEMISNFGTRGEFFSRTLAETGSMGFITGSCGWREFELPFLAEGGMRPDRLTVNLVLPGPGTVVVGPITIHSIESGWWSPQQGGLVGGVGGSGLGLLGAAIGVMAARRKSRETVKVLLGVGIVLGVICLGVGIAALAMRQPFHVTYPLLLLGGISTLVLGGNSLMMARRIRDDELRQIAALDA